MSDTLLWWPDADGYMQRLEGDPSLDRALAAVRRTLGRLETTPFDLRLRTRQFVTDQLRHIHATPTGHGDWYVFWQDGLDPETVEIVQIAELTI
ncbi:MAG: hypothetical protein ABR511_02555 [Acidimicrobiales bacterium]